MSPKKTYSVSPLLPLHFSAVQLLSERCFANPKEHIRFHFLHDLHQKQQLYGWVIPNTPKSDSILGYVVLNASPSTHIHMDLLSIAIHPLHQGKGLAKMLLNATLTHIPQTVDTISLEVRESHTAAQHLYRSVEFCYSHTRKRYYSDGENALCFVWKKNKGP